MIIFRKEEIKVFRLGEINGKLDNIRKLIMMVSEKTKR